MIRLPTLLRTRIVNWRDAVYARIQSETPVVDAVKQAAWEARGRHDVMTMLDPGAYDYSANTTERAELGPIVTAILNRFPGDRMLDAKCGILFDRSEIADRLTLHDHSLGIDA